MSAGELVDVVVGRITPDGERVVLVELLPAGPHPLPPFEAGAHVDLHVGGFVRQYSLLGSDDDAGRYVVGVLRERAGRGGSAAVHDTVRSGDRLQVSVPRNTFGLDPEAEHSVLVAGGIGLTPLVAMAERLHREGRSFELHVFTWSAGTLPLGAHLASRPWRDRVVTHFSSAGDSFRGKAPAVVPRPRPGLALYVCGPLGLTASATACASALEWPRADVHVEHFERSAPVETGGDAFTVVAASTGTAMAVAGDETIAEVLRRHGYDVVLSCEQGICGSCLTGVVDGVPDHRDEVQTVDEHAANAQVNVCCSRSQTPTLTLAV
ncbi:PDR/VanB family oxidoreductase [Luteimicrobium sp. NPDC057192]|uniref:PDR/VanB family oxidoreductase n=1 Tax=Luteimicrobium sp. NPDC057192 TaxID=3346042 RepID=UPI0036323A0F